MTDPNEVMQRAEALNTAIREMSDLLMGGVRTLVDEGWSEEQARVIVVSAFAAQARGGAA